jgi:hypothetical protein
MGIYRASPSRFFSLSDIHVYTFALSTLKHSTLQFTMFKVVFSLASRFLYLGNMLQGFAHRPTGSLRSEALTPSPPVLLPPFPLLHLSRFWMLLFPLRSFWKRLFHLYLPLLSNTSLQPFPRPFLAISRLLLQHRPASFLSFCLFLLCLQPSLDSSSFSLELSTFLPRLSPPLLMRQELLPNHSNPFQSLISCPLACLLGFPRRNCLFLSFLCYFCGLDQYALLSSPFPSS